MDFEYSDEQVLLRDTTATLLSRAYDAEKRNQIIDTDLGWSREVWGQLAEVGLLGLTFSEEDGGMDAGPIEVHAVLTELGRRLAPEPIVDCVLTPGGLISDLGSVEQRKVLADVAEGTVLLAFAHQEPGVRWPSTELSTVASSDCGVWTISGRKNPVPHGDCADRFVVSAALPDGGVGLFLVDAAAVQRRGYRTFDGLRAAQLDFDGVVAEPLGNGGDATAAIAASDIRTQAALCAEAVGAMEEALRLTTEYLKTRKQFGVTLSKFQALTFRAADMYVSLELARSMALYATMAIADDTLDAIIASRAKLQIGRSGRHIGQEAIQLHGGIGVTAEYPVGHYTARLTAIDRLLGSADDHLRVLAGNVGAYELAEL